MTESNAPNSQVSGNADRPTVLSYATPEPVADNPKAMWAMVCAISFLPALSLGYLTRFPGILVFGAMPATAIAAIVLGYMGMRPTGPPRGRGVAQAALILGCIFLALLVLGGLLTPSLSASKPRADIVKCASNLRQIGWGIGLYANDNKGMLPPDLGVLVVTFDLSTEVLVCPATSDSPGTGPTTQAAARDAIARKGHCSYIYLGRGLNQNSTSPDHVLAYDNSLKNHESYGMNVLRGDGRVDWLWKQEALDLLAELKAGHNPPRPQVPTSRP